MVADSSSAVALICSAEESVHAASAGGFRDPSQFLRGRLALLERLGLLLHCCLGLAGGRRLFFRRAGDQGCALFRFGRGAIGLQGFGQGLLAAVGDLLHIRAQAVEALDGGGAGLRFVDRGFGRLLQSGGDLAHVGLDSRSELLHLLRALLGSLGERAHFVGDDREAAAVIAGACRFDRRVQRQEIGLIGDAADRGGDLADVLGAPLEFADELDRRALTEAVALDRADGRADLHRGFGEHHLDRFGAAA